MAVFALKGDEAFTQTYFYLLPFNYLEFPPC